jgi:hypothetical protein
MTPRRRRSAGICLAALARASLKARKAKRQKSKTPRKLLRGVFVFATDFVVATDRVQPPSRTALP